MEQEKSNGGSETQKKITISFVVNGSCNNNCMFCSKNGSRKERDMSEKEVIEKIDATIPENGSPVVLSGGEPSMQEGICKIVSHLAKRGHKVKMITNGRLFSGMEFTKKIASCGLSEIITEIHSSFPEIHDYLTQRPGSFNETIAGIRNALERGLRIKVKIILNRITYARLPETVCFISNTVPNIDRIIIASLSLEGNALANKDLLGVRHSDVRPYIEKSIDAAKSRNMNIELDRFPMCALGPQYRRYSVPRVRHRFQDNERQFIAEKYMPRSCQECELEHECAGVYRSHLAEFGDGEIKPIKESAERADACKKPSMA